MKKQAYQIPTMNVVKLQQLLLSTKSLQRVSTNLGEGNGLNISEEETDPDFWSR